MEFSQYDRILLENNQRQMILTTNVECVILYKKWKFRKKNYKQKAPMLNPKQASLDEYHR